MGLTLRYSYFKAKLLNLLGIIFILALGTGAASCSSGGGGGLFAPGGGALDGKNPPSDIIQNTPMEEVAVGPASDPLIVVALTHCINAKCPIPLDLPNEQEEEWDGCYQITFDLGVTYLSDPYANQVLRMVDSVKGLFIDMKTDASGRVDNLTIEVSPVMVVNFYWTQLPNPVETTWKPCPGNSCIDPATMKLAQKSFGGDCGFLESKLPILHTAPSSVIQTTFPLNLTP